MKKTVKGLAGACALAFSMLALFPGVSSAAICVATSALTNPDGQLLNADSCGVIANVPNGPGNNDQDETDAVSAASGLTLTFLDKDDAAGIADNGFLFTGLTFDNDGKATTGTWAIDIQGVPGGPFSDFAIALKDGSPLAQGLLWFNVDTSINTPPICPVGYEFCGEWAMYGNDPNGVIRHGVSHMDLFGVAGTTLPEPGSLLLLSTVLGGIGLAARRRKASPIRNKAA